MLDLDQQHSAQGAPDRGSGFGLSAPPSTATDRPIIFSPAMVRALISGTKTQTRRLATSPLARCNAGDRLWVREAHHRTDDHPDSHLIGYDTTPGVFFDSYNLEIPGTGRVGFFSHSLGGWGGRSSRNFPSIHMPRWASRLTLIVGGVKVEPLHRLTSEDAKAEGIEWLGTGYRHYLDDAKRVPFADTAFKFLWSSLHTQPGERWDDNPQVVALTFRVVRGNIDRLGLANG